MASKFDQNFCEVRLYFRLGENEADAERLTVLLKELAQGQKPSSPQEPTA